GPSGRNFGWLNYSTTRALRRALGELSPRLGPIHTVLAGSRRRWQRPRQVREYLADAPTIMDTRKPRASEFIRRVRGGPRPQVGADGSAKGVASIAGGGPGRDR